MPNYRGVKLNKATCRAQRQSCRPMTPSNAKAFILTTQYEVPFIIKSEATKRSTDRKENDKLTNSTNRRSRVGLFTPFYTAILGNVKL